MHFLLRRPDVQHLELVPPHLSLEAEVAQVGETLEDPLGHDFLQVHVGNGGDDAPLGRCPRLAADEGE
jgi:hypothetical protein